MTRARGAPIVILWCASFAMAAITANSASAFRLREGQSGTSLVWKQNKVDVVVDTSNVPGIGGAYDAVLGGFYVWTSSGVPLRLAFSQATTPQSTTDDGVNVVRWAKDDWKYGIEVVGMTVTMYKKSTGEITEADIVLNARDHGWDVVRGKITGRYDIQNVVAHEAGHFVGLGHSEVLDATMFATTPADEISKQTLSDDDRAGIAALIQLMSARSLPIPATPHEEPVARSTELQSSPLPARGGGCELAPGSSPPSWPWLIGMLGGLHVVTQRQRRHSTRSSALIATMAVAAFVGLPAPRHAHASAIELVSLDGLAERSEQVLRGQVVGVRTYLEGDMIYTDYELAVDACLKGSCGKSSVLHTLGGEMGDRGVAVDGMPKLTQGARLLLFGRAYGTKLLPIGLAQGVFQIVGTTAVRDLRGLNLVDQSRMPLGAGALERMDFARLELTVRAAVARLRPLALPTMAPSR